MFTKETISKYIEEKKLLVQKHPTADLYIYRVRGKHITQRRTKRCQ